MAEWSSDDDDGYELYELDQDDYRYDWLEDKMNSTIVPHNGRSFGYYYIENVFEVNNPSLWNLYYNRRREISWELGNRRVHEMRLFHGTRHAMNIVENGFDISRAESSSMFGRGIYFSNLSSKCNQYTENRNQTCLRHGVVLCTRCTRLMLMCRVALGRKFYATEPMNGIDSPPEDFHSVVAKPKPGFLNYPEYVVYDPHQVVTSYLIQYKIGR